MEKVVQLNRKQDTQAAQMGIVQTKIGKIAAWALELPRLERQGIAAAMDYIEGIPGEDEKAAMVMALERVLSARIRGIRAHNTDVKKRTLIGARVNREFAERCKQAAQASGRSITKWCYAALWDALLKQERLSRVESVEPENGSENSIWYGMVPGGHKM